MRKFVPFAALVLVAAAGCKPKPEDQVVGTWSGMGNGTVSINKDKTWTSEMPAGGMTAKVNGKWSITGNTLDMKIDTVNGQPVQTIIDQISKMMPKDAPKIAEQMKGFKLDLTEDGKSLGSKTPGPGGQTLTLTKQAG